jgi:hypothetical protein
MPRNQKQIGLSAGDGKIRILATGLYISTDGSHLPPGVEIQFLTGQTGNGMRLGVFVFIFALYGQYYNHE